MKRIPALGRVLRRAKYCDHFLFTLGTTSKCTVTTPHARRPPFATAGEKRVRSRYYPSACRHSAATSKAVADVRKAGKITRTRLQTPVTTFVASPPQALSSSTVSHAARLAAPPERGSPGGNILATGHIMQ